MTGKKIVAVFMGGMSPEHEVSLNSGAGVCRALDQGAYSPLPVVIHKDGQWQIGDALACSIFDALPQLKTRGVACAFIALHGPFGEDGRMQGLLDLLGIPYTGSGCAASALAMDKVRCKAVVRSQGIRVAGHLALDQETWRVDDATVRDAVQKDIGFPCVIKACSQGSSVGVEIPHDMDEFNAAIPRVFQVEEYLFIEEFIHGTEVTCGVLDVEGSERIRPLPVTEIRPKAAAFFNYEAKYVAGASEEITPARIDPELRDMVQEMAVDVHEIVGCSGWSRSDFIIDDEGPVWIEINTVPGLTATSLYPQAAAAAGISYGQMVELFVAAALREPVQGI